jgi:hypothetical protein
MARQKATVTLDRRKAEEARTLIGGRSISEVIDTALDHLIQAERLRRDIAAYRQRPPGEGESIDLPVEFDLGDADVDYEKDYGRSRQASGSATRRSVVRRRPR